VRACLVSTYPPRQCGIATFTRDLRDSMVGGDRTASVSVAAIGAAPRPQRYPAEVVVEIDRDNAAAYRRAARVLDRQGFDVVCLQHEFGIFGGEEGRHIVDLLDELRTPTVSTLHTVLSEPDDRYGSALLEVARASDRLVVHSHAARALLDSVYGVDLAKVEVIPHGVPDVPFERTDRAKAELGFDGRLVALTFGLVSQNKGVEFVIEALPDVVASHPDVLYVVLGTTHPEVKRRDGERYRESLQRRVAELNLEKHVEFHDRYVNLDELTEYLASADVYVTPYQSRDQIVSGTLAYAVGMGKAVLSTPYLYAEELLADGRGRLVGFGDPAGLAEGLRAYLDEEEERDRTRRRAYAYGRHMTWPRVGARYLELFEQLRSAATDPVPRSPGEDTEVPTVNLDHLRRMTDDVGIVQHAVWRTPDRRYGYTTDDVSRALIVAVRRHARTSEADLERLISTYLSYLAHAQRDDGRFRNTLGYDRHWEDSLGSEDTYGQTLWGLGTAVSVATDTDVRGVARELFKRALPAVSALEHSRAIAYAVCGLCAGLDARPGDRELLGALRTLTDRLVNLYERSLTDEWRWFGTELTYANAKLPHALLLAAQSTGNQRFAEVGLDSLDFLLDQTVVDGRFEFVGNESWYRRGGPRSAWGQQPIEAGYTIEVCLLAAQFTSPEPAARYHELARAAVDWFNGRNRLGVALYDPRTGACADGLDREGASRNAGAESVICCLMGLMAAEEAGLGPASNLAGATEKA